MINYEHSPINWLIKKKHSQLAWAELVPVELQETMPLSLGRLMCIPISSPSFRFLRCPHPLHEVYPF